MKLEDYERVIADLKRRRIPTEIKTAVSLMLDKKAENVVVLKLKNVTDITDYMVICSGRSDRQNSAISHEIQKKLSKEFKLNPLGVEGEREGEWILVDYVDFIIHIFSIDARKKYALEKLWMDAKRYDFYLEQEPEG